MSRAIRVRFEKGVLRPLDAVDLRDGEELEVVIVQRSFRGFREVASRYRFKVDRDIVGDFLEERR
ncbi:MAG: antitoxin family protein [Crenarchaeota archaeon]|nr:antitoxin family protein [Thermoproteota archaeon]